jgi:DNA-binding GntR family transcriptional regulator
MQDTSLEVKTYDTLKRMMLNFELTPGQRVVITELAEHLEVSRTPVKMAVITLFKEGYLDYSPRKGYYTIHQVSRGELDHLHDFREFLELGAVEKAVANLTPKLFAALETKARLFKEAAAIEDHELCFLMELDFHSSILEMAGNPYLVEAFRDTFQKFFMRRHISSHFEARYEKFLQEHDAIIAAFRERDACKVREALIAHITAGKEFIGSHYCPVNFD